jgi:riboflavin kinase/FMN adenylyltransferase
MQVFRGIPERAEHGCVLTIGNFDGVHRGHQALLAKLTDKARVTGLPSAVLTFEPHPREFFAHDNRPRPHLAAREDPASRCQGVDRLYIARFNARFAGLTAEQFIEDVLIHGLGVRH